MTHIVEPDLDMLEHADVMAGNSRTTIGAGLADVLKMPPVNHRTVIDARCMLSR